VRELAEGLQTTAGSPATTAPADPFGAADAARAGETPGGAARPTGAAACPSCGAGLVGDYCHRCGEKRADARDLTLRHFLHDAAQELTSLEHSKLLRTLRALLFRPGRLSAEWVAGRRNLYLKPLNLYLAVFALSLFAFSVYEPLSMYNLQAVVERDATGVVGKGVEELAARRGLRAEEFTAAVSGRWHDYMSLSSVFLAACYALLLHVVFLLFERRHFVEHLVFSLHFVSFSSLLVVLMWPLYFFTGVKPSPATYALAALVWLLIAVYMFLAVRTFYRPGTAAGLLLTLVLLAGYFAVYMAAYTGSMAAALLSVIVG
jgi:hypothetical protein